MGKSYKRMSCSQRRAFIQSQISLLEEPRCMGVFCAHADSTDSSTQEVVDDSILSVVDCDSVFQEDCQLIYVADESGLEYRIQKFMNRYPVELAEEFVVM